MTMTSPSAPAGATAASPKPILGEMLCDTNEPRFAMAGPQAIGTSPELRANRRRPRPIPCRDQYGWERPLGSRPRSTQGGGPSRRSDGGPTNGGVGAGVGDHHSHALRFLFG